MAFVSHLGSAARQVLPQPNFVCVHCRLRAPTAVRIANASISQPYASQRSASYINKLRTKIFGAKKSPQLERRESQRRERNERRKLRKTGMVEPGSQNQYVKATTIQGLETVGGPGWGDQEWEEGDDKNSFQGFMDPEKIADRNATILAVHRALVETYTLKEAGLPLILDYYSIDPTDDYSKRVAEGARFEQDVNGQMSLMLESEELRHSILECVTPKAPEAPEERDDSATGETEIEDEEYVEREEISEEGMASKGAEEQSLQIVEDDDDINPESEGSEGPIVEEDAVDPEEVVSVPPSDTWRNVSLEDAAIKFAVLKRVMQLTGRRIPDPDISGITTPMSLLVHLIKKPKPKRVAKALMKSNPVAHLPNVHIQDKRYGLIDREMENGRWKIIEEELEKRGLRASLSDVAVGR